MENAHNFVANSKNVYPLAGSSVWEEETVSHFQNSTEKLYSKLIKSQTLEHEPGAEAPKTYSCER